MKRLLEDPEDDVTRLLIAAGVQHQPPAGGKARLIATLGLGSLLWSWTSEAWAWFGTGAGKLTLVVVAAGAAAGGGLYGGEPTAASSARAETSAEREPTGATVPRAELGTLAKPASPSAAVEAPDVAGERETAEATVVDEPAAGDSVGVRSTARRATASATRREAAAARPSPRGTRRASQGAVDEGELREETRWVERMQEAAARQDRATLDRLQSGYAARFPAGQLRPEVKRIEDSL